jgi:hypothetical protein
MVAREGVDCGTMPATFMEALASSIQENAEGDTFLNVICYDEDCADMTSAVDCDTPVTDAEAFVVANAFGFDSCGNLALKLRVCVVADAETNPT